MSERTVRADLAGLVLAIGHRQLPELGEQLALALLARGLGRAVTPEELAAIRANCVRIATNPTHQAALEAASAEWRVHRT
jgi:hypothetical protein